MELAKNEKSCLVQVRSQPQGTGKNPAQTSLIGKNWITRCLNRHPELALKFASRIDRQCANPYIIQTHFHKLEVIRDNDIKDNGITNVDEKGFIMGISLRTHCITKRGHKNPHVKQDRKAVKTFSLPPHTASIGLFSFQSTSRLQQKHTLSVI